MTRKDSITWPLSRESDFWQIITRSSSWQVNHLAIVRRQENCHFQLVFGKKHGAARLKFHAETKCNDDDTRDFLLWEWSIKIRQEGKLMCMLFLLLWLLGDVSHIRYSINRFRTNKRWNNNKGNLHPRFTYQDQIIIIIVFVIIINPGLFCLQTSPSSIQDAFSESSCLLKNTPANKIKLAWLFDLLFSRKLEFSFAQHFARLFIDPSHCSFK